MTTVYVTAGLIDVLLELAADREPNSVSVALSSTPAAELGVEDSATPAPDTPVLSDFYLPSEGRSIDAVFGVDISEPHGQTAAQFVSHPDGDPQVRETDDIREVTIVAIPPWDRDSVQAYNRGNEALSIELVAVEEELES